MYKQVAAAMGQETEDGRASVPLAQARSLLKFLLWRLGPLGGGLAWAAVYVAGGSAVMVAGRLSWALHWPRPAAGSGL